MPWYRDSLKPEQGDRATIEGRSHRAPLESALIDRRDVLKLAGAAIMANADLSKSAAAELGNRSLLIAANANVSGFSATTEEPLIFPKPREIELSAGQFALNESTAIVVSANASANDLSLSRFLTAELSDRYGLKLRTEHSSRSSAAGPVVVMGTVWNPLIREYSAREGIQLPVESPGSEEYVLRITEGVVLIAGRSERGAFYGLQSLRQMIRKGDGELRLRSVRVRDWPDKSFRGIKVYLPGRANIPFFKRFLRDFVALYKFNTVMMEMNACMRLDRHPELNAGWIEFARDTNYSRRNYPPGPLHDREQNSSHQDCCDGALLEKEEVADLVRWAAENHLEVIPEIPSLTHSFYLLSKPPARSRGRTAHHSGNAAADSH
jgi:hypothetical protein